MNVINASILRNNFADVLSEVSSKRDFLLISKKGKLTSALVNIDLFEDLLALANKPYRVSIQKARKEYRAGDVFTHEQAFGDV